MDLFKMRLIGSASSPRYLIRDNRNIGLDRFWTGKKWTNAYHKSKLYYDPLKVMGLIYRMTRKHFSRKYSERRYTLTIDVRVYGPESVDPAMVEDYLRKAMSLNLDYTTHSFGPDAETFVEARIPQVSLK